MSAQSSAAMARGSESSQASGFRWRWIVVGFGLYVVFAVAMYPASRLVPWLQKSGVIVAGTTGTVWHGRAAGLQVRGITMGPTEWRVEPLRLFTGAIAVSLHSERSDGYLDAKVMARFGGSVVVENARGALPLNALSGLGLPGGGTQGWNGNVLLKLEELRLVNGWPVAIRGDIDLANLVGPPRQPTQLGGYRISFLAPNAKATNDEVHGAVQSMDDAPLDVTGSIKLMANRNYVIDAQVATRSGAPTALVKALEYLGPPDGQGRRPLSVAGSL